MNLAFAIKNGAQAVAKGTGSVLDFLDDAGKKLEPLASLPLVGGTIADLKDLVSMLHDYYHGEYKQVPAVVMAGTAAIIAYLVSPIDLIPDGVPILGFIDDAFIINIIIQLCIDKELERYRAWRSGEEPAAQPAMA